MSDYMWTLASAIYQVTHGGPTQRTLSAINWLGNRADEPVANDNELRRANLALELLDALVESRGLQHLGEALEPLPDETESIEGQLNDNLETLGDAIKNMKR